MGFRNPATSASAVDTGGTGGKVRIYNKTTTSGGSTTTSGVVEFDDGIGGDVPASITASAVLSAGAEQGGGMSSGGGSWNGVTAPTVQTNVEAAPAGGYTPVARVAGGPLVVSGTITAAAATDAVPLTLNGPAFAVATGGRGAGCYKDANGDVRFDGLIQNGSLISSAAGQILGNAPAGYAPAVNRWFFVPIYPLAVVALVGVRSSGSIVLDAISGSIAASSYWDVCAIRYNPTSTS